MYADDLFLYGTLPALDPLSVQRFQEDLDHLQSTLLGLGLAINASKTQVIVFKKGRAITRPLLRLHRQLLPSVTTCSLLGITLNHNLNWNAYYETLLVKLTHRFNLFRYITGQDWGMHPTSLYVLYHNFIQALLDYGSPIIGRPSAKYHRQLLSILYRIHKTILGVARKPSRQKVAELLQLESSSSRQLRLTHRKIGSLWRSTQSPLFNKLLYLSRHWTQFSSSPYPPTPVFLQSFREFSSLPLIQQFPRPPLYCVDYEVIIHPVSLDLTTFSKQDPFIRDHFAAYIGEHSLDLQPPILLFTDGSKTKDGTGAAFYNQTHANFQQFRLDPLWSSYSAELIAIRQALISITHVQAQTIFIFSDCRSALLNIAGTHFNVHRGWIEINCKLTIHRLTTTQRNSLILVWVPGHTGILGNERVDQLAKQAIHLPTQASFLVPIGDAISHVTRSSTEPRSRPWFYKSKNSRSEISLAAKIFLNIALTPHFLCQIRQRDHPYCECGQLGSLNHIILSCPRFDTYRAPLLTFIQEIPFHGPWDTVQLLFYDPPKFSILLKKYLAKCKMKL